MCVSAIGNQIELTLQVTLSIGVSVISTLTVCAILSLIAWNCCLRSQGKAIFLNMKI